MSIQLSLAAFFVTFFPMLVIGIGLGVWAARHPTWPRRGRKREDLRKTLNGVRIEELLEKCKRDSI